MEKASQRVAAGDNDQRKYYKKIPKHTRTPQLAMAFPFTSIASSAHYFQLNRRSESEKTPPKQNRLGQGLRLSSGIGIVRCDTRRQRHGWHRLAFRPREWPS